MNYFFLNLHKNDMSILLNNGNILIGKQVE